MRQMKSTVTKGGIYKKKQNKQRWDCKGLNPNKTN